jgi:dTDP-4-dehydrorhamnose 3,5-epimerase
VPPGCAHGFLVVSEKADFHYKVTQLYEPQAERSLSWDDPDLCITWPLQPGERPILSPKDAAAVCFRVCEKYE